MEVPREPAPNASARPFVVPCAALRLDAPWRWLRLGWRDLRRAPGLSLVFGGAIMTASRRPSTR